MRRPFYAIWLKGTPRRKSRCPVTLNNLTATLVGKWRVVHDDAEKSQILEATDRRIQKAMSIQPDAARYNFACVLAVQAEGTKP